MNFHVIFFRPAAVGRAVHMTSAGGKLKSTGQDVDGQDADVSQILKATVAR